MIIYSKLGSCAGCTVRTVLLVFSLDGRWSCTQRSLAGSGQSAAGRVAGAGKKKKKKKKRISGRLAWLCVVYYSLINNRLPVPGVECCTRPSVVQT